MSQQYDNMQGNVIDIEQHPDTNLPSSQYWGTQSIQSQIAKLETNMKANEAVKTNRGSIPKP